MTTALDPKSVCVPTYAEERGLLEVENTDERMGEGNREREMGSVGDRLAADSRFPPPTGASVKHMYASSLRRVELRGGWVECCNTEIFETRGEILSVIGSTKQFLAT